MQNLETKPIKQSDRRQLTILHCDIVNSTILTEDLDIEEIDVIKDKFEVLCTEIIQDNNGTIGRYTGDGIEGYFGYPVANEDSVKHALTAAFQLRDQIKTIDVPRGELKLRIGVATGEAVVSTLSNTPFASNYRASGLVTNIAARLTNRFIADENQILVDDTTKSLSEKSFMFSNAGAQELRGISDPVQLWELQTRKASESRFEERSKDLSPFIGRETEQKLLFKRWQKTHDGQGGLILIEGEAGIGKSRLIHEFLSSLGEATNALKMYLQCSPQFSLSPLHPWIRNLSNQSDISELDAIEIKKNKLKSHVFGLGFSPTFFEILASQMGISENTDKVDSSISPQKKAEIIKDEIFDYFKQTLKEKKVLIVIEDIHWADETTLSLIEKLTPEFHQLGGLILASSRQNHPNLENLMGADVISPPKMTNSQVDDLTQALLSQTTIKPELIQTIRANTDGIPLFVEEIVNSFAERSNNSKEDLSSKNMKVPISLNNFLSEKLDNLESGKRIAQIASNFGREFSKNDLLNLGNTAKKEIDNAIEKLLDARLIVKQQDSDIYAFRHALFQTATYESQLKSNRRVIHQLIAQDLVKQLHTRINKNPELIAHHFQAAEINDQALKYWTIAGNRSLESGATQETVKLLVNANSILDLSNEGREYLELLHNFYLLNGKALNATQGARSAEAESAFRKAGEISEKLDNIDSQIHCLDSEFGIIFNSGEVMRSSIPAIKMVRTGNTKNNNIGKICGYQSLGMVCFTIGKLDKAKMYLEKAIVDSNKNVVGINSYPSLALTYLAFTNYLLNNKKVALDLCEQAIASARSESLYSLGVSLGNSCYLYRFAEDHHKIEINSSELVDVTKNIGQMMWHRRGLFFQNWCFALNNNDQSYLPNMQELIDELISAKEEVDITVYYSSLAKAQMHFDLYDQSIHSLESAINIAKKNHEFYYLPEIYRMYGELLSTKQDSLDIAIDYYQLAVDTAKNQNALMWIEKLQNHQLN